MRIRRWLQAHPSVLAYVMLLGVTVGGFRQLAAERHDRCVNSRTDTQAAIVAGMDAAGVRAETQRIVADAVARALPVDEC